MKHSLLLLAIIFNVLAYAQDSLKFTDLFGEYLGQVPPGEIPVVFAPGTVSDKGSEHSAAVFSPDGNEVFWSAGKIFHMKRIQNRWTTPQPLSLFDDSLRIVDQPFIALDGEKLYFNSEGPSTSKQDLTPQQWSRYNNEDIWHVKRDDKNWTNPKSLSPVINTDYLQAQASFNKTGTAYFLTYLDGVAGECGIYRAKYKNGNYLSPEALPECINSKAQDWTPYIAPDDSYLIFSSYRDGGFGQGDLYISFHDVKTDKWFDPVNLGESINTTSQERFPAVSPDGKYLFFTRWTSENNHDIFWVSTAVINKLKDNYE